VDAAVAWVAPMGATYEPGGEAVEFRIAAPRATRVEVWIYAEAVGAAEVMRVALDRDGDVWATRIEGGLPETVFYGYRVWGPSWAWDPAWLPGSEAGFVARVTADGDRMNPNKLLIDPYAKELSHDPIDASANRTDDEHRTIDSAPVAPKGIVLRDEGVDTGPAPTRALRDDVIDEVHLRGLTAGDGGPCAGTYAAAAERAAYLAELGVTAVEFLPVQETWNDGNDADPTSASGDNYWGYSTLAFFAPDRRYACDRTPGGPTREWRAMVRAFHEHGVKVLIDVVYNHTAEGGGGSLLSWRGVDNATYYELDAAGTGFADQTGIGASTNATSPVFRDLVIDSLRYWHEELGVDGFRFDLAPVLGNACARACFDYQPDDPDGILVRATELGVDLIAEPWGIGGGTYQVGHFPPGWSEWNDRYRDTIRQDVNLAGVTDVTLGWLADRISGSPDLFGARGPEASIDYVVSHDGFTLHDLVACNGKSNDQGWPYGPSGGGTDANYSWDYGGVAARQRQAARTTLAILMLSAGVPMITGGDEMLRGQRCNNNPYNLDSTATWIDWTDLDAQAAFATFTRRLIAFRHAHPALRPATWWTGATIAWLGTDGRALPDALFDDPGAHFLGWRLDGLYVAYNGAPQALTITLPAGATWRRAADTAAAMEPSANFREPGEEDAAGPTYAMAARSLAIFVEQP
jgi:glycogen operon protein